MLGCAGQAADAVSAYTHVKMEDSTSSIENSEVRMSRHLDTSTTTQVAKILVQYGRPSRSSLSEFCMVNRLQDYNGKGNSKKKTSD